MKQSPPLTHEQRSRAAAEAVRQVAVTLDVSSELDTWLSDGAA